MYTAAKIALSPLPVMYHLPLTDWANLGQVSYEQLHTSVTETRTSVYRSKREEVGKMSMRSERSIILTILDRAFYEQFAPVRDRKQNPPTPHPPIHRSLGQKVEKNVNAKCASEHSLELLRRFLGRTLSLRRDTNSAAASVSKPEFLVDNNELPAAAVSTRYTYIDS